MDCSEEWRPDAMPTLVINRCARALSRQVDESLRAIGVSAAQLPVMVALKDGQGHTQKQLAEAACVEQPSMAQLLARMERDGLVRREKQPTDGRSSLVFLTDQAFEKLELGRGVLRRLDAEICSIFTDAEKATLLALLSRVQTASDAGAASARL